MRHVFGPDGDLGGHWIVGLVFWVVMLVAIIAAVIVIVRLVGRRPAGLPPLWGGAWWQTSGPHHALTELDLRYARGEIDRNDYLQRRADLLGQPPPSGAGPAPGPTGGTTSTPKAP